ncbi:uncharacterized protein BP5553_01843 [Venustampulla echinocandica]|uniref:Uncharacterized protein n=1 Tax=Venustampulla echinocandica TaxID=2656787 RepID=A0A370U259_9HELO|nr:uncharacterized protein BP5553_01843 [Venustampulla echinocandica]RDL41864.1 hypothetical protein BP5553_01843 [Venustampulla echinocandica]
MEQSSAKRRKTSPTTSIPIDAPGTPSRIPVRRQDAAKTPPRRPSFASPTKASIARHNPQLLTRPSSSGSGVGRTSIKSRKLDDIFANALGEVRPAIESQNAQVDKDRVGVLSQGTVMQGNNGLRSTDNRKPITPNTKGSQPVRRGLAAKPKRMSRSPAKPPRRRSQANGRNIYDGDFQDVDDPFQKKGLKRSPIPSQVDTVPDDIDPFRKGGLRRSPVVDAPAQDSAQDEPPPEISMTPTSSPPSQSADHLIPADTQRPKHPAVVPDFNQTLPIRQIVGSNISDDTRLQEENEQLEQYEEQEKDEQQEQQEQEEQEEQEDLEQLEQLEASEGPEAAHTLSQITTTARTIDDIQLQEKPITSSISPPKPLDWRAAGTTHSRKLGIFRRSSPFNEPELPPTPTERGIPDPIVTTPPSGILNTPSKRARKRSALGSKLKSSPLKPRDQSLPLPTKDTAAVLEPEFRSEHKPENPIIRRRSARFIAPEDPHAAKKQARDDLLKELQQLQADVALANQENERLRLQHDSGRRYPKRAPNSDELLALLLRSTELPSKPKLKPPSIFKTISAFLPFSSLRRSKPPAIPSIQKPLPSHLPVHLDDPLPYLQAFSPLTFTSTITLLPPSEQLTPDLTSENHERSILQCYHINVSHAPRLFAAQLSMVVDSLTLSITEIEILKLTACAEKELGTFVRKRVSTQGIFGKDISVICWSMGRWTEVATKRAGFWCAVGKEFGTAEGRNISFHRMTRKKKRKRTQVPVIQGDEDDEHEGNDDEDDDEMVTKQQWTTKQVLPHMGRTSFELATEEVQLLFEWNISFDWTGEVQSSLSAYARTPKNWQNTDERNSLVKIPEMFDRLVKERGPLRAVGAVVGLLMPMS